MCLVGFTLRRMALKLIHHLQRPNHVEPATESGLFGERRRSRMKPIAISFMVCVDDQVRSHIEECTKLEHIKTAKALIMSCLNEIIAKAEKEEQDE